MKRGVLCFAVIVGASLTVVAAFRLLQARASAPLQLASLMPTGALLEIQAKDFASLVRDWNDSREKQLWLSSDNYQMFSRSRLYLRLDRSRREFESAAGVPPDMAFLNAIAGSEAALALYDIGKLEFLYVTHMPSAQTAETVLWQRRGDYQTRSVAGQQYYVKVDPGSQRTVAFAATSELLLLATREDLLAGALKMVSGEDSASRSSIEAEHWFSQATRAANARGPEGDVRLVLNLAALARSSYFRSYWIQNNVSDVRAYDSAVCDVYRSSNEIREERIFFRPDSGGATSSVAETASAGVADEGKLLAFVPPDAGFYRGWAHPSPEEIVGIWAGTVLAPRPSRPLAGNQAPIVSLNGGETGSTSDLETRIDQAPPPSTEGALAAGPLQALLASAHADAVLEVESSHDGTGSVLPEHRAAVLVAAPEAWDAGAAHKAVQAAIAALWTTSGLGTRWVAQSEGGVTFDALDGLAPIEIATRGTVLAVADDPGLMVEILRQPPGRQKLLPAQYTAGVRPGLERQPFETMTRLIDSAGAGATPDGVRQPSFFAGNIGSLARAASRVESASIELHDTGNTVLQTVTYRLSPPQ